MIMAFDPSSTCTGWAIGEKSKVVKAGYVKPKQSLAAIERIEETICEVVGLLEFYKPDAVIIEETSGKIHNRIKKSNPSGLAVYGMAVGAVYATCVMHVIRQRCSVDTVKENEWTHGSKKSARQVMAGIYYPDYGEMKEFDKGMDISDAICLLEWYFVNQRIKAMR